MYYKHNQIKHNLLISSYLLAFLFISCQGNKKENAQELSHYEAVKIPVFHADSAYKFVQEQVNFGPRIPNTFTHRACFEYLTKKFKSYSANVIVQEAKARAFNGEMLDMKNIIASYNVESHRRILLTAHWDTRPFADQDTADQDQPILGANDGGSGVAVLLEIARLLKDNPMHSKIGLDIILFDAEDYGQPNQSKFRQQDDTYCLGSQHWSKNNHRENYAPIYGILLDMVGAKDARFYQEGNSTAHSPDIVKKVWNMAHSLGFSDYFLFASGNPVMDDHYYIIQETGIKMIDIIHQDMQTSSQFTPSWHTHQDNMDIISTETLNAVGTTLTHLIYSEKY